MSLSLMGRDIPTDADSFSYLLEHKILLKIMLSSWKEKDQTTHTKHTTHTACCWSKLTDCTQFSTKYNKIYVNHEAVLACILLFAETNLCDIAYQGLPMLASSFWANPPLLVLLIDFITIEQSSQLRLGPNALIPVQCTQEPAPLPRVGKGEEGMK